jgi:cytochrome c553
MKDTLHQDLSQVDQDFEPYEPYRPIPLLVIAVVCALAIWGALTYLDDLGAAEAFLAGAKPVAPSLAARKMPAAEQASGLDNAPPQVLALVRQGRDQMWSCASCHGEAGEGNASTPRLAGQVSDYLTKQLVDFRTGVRANAHMAYVAKTLGESEIQALAAYYSQIRLPSLVGPRLDGNLERGKQLTHDGDWKRNVPACVQCHGAGGEGVRPSFPVLAGQQPEYVFGQLAQWHAGARGNSPQHLMDRVVQRMTPEDLRAVADYLSTLPLRPSPPAEDVASVPGSPLKVKSNEH